MPKRGHLGAYEAGELCVEDREIVAVTRILMTPYLTRILSPHLTAVYKRP
jgi:hypothetical protein